MRPCLSRAPGLLLCLSLAIAPDLAWAAPSPVRTNLEKSQTTATEVRWQPIPRIDTVTEPWQLVTSKQDVTKTPLNPRVMRYQEVRTDLYRRRTTTYPLETKEQRTKTTTTQNYELKTYAELSTSSTVMVPVTRVTGEWVTRTTDKPVMTTVQEWSNEPELVPTQEAVFKTVTSTYSIAPQAIKTNVAFTKMVPTPQDEEVTKTKTETYNTTQRVRYNGHMYDANSGKDMGTVQMWDDETGLTLSCSDPRLNANMTFTDGTKKKLTYAEEAGWGRATSKDMLQGNCVVTEANGRTYLEFDADHRFFGWSNWWGARPKVKLDNYLVYDTQVSATREVTYTETVTKMVDVATPATLAIQLEKLSGASGDLQGQGAGGGVYWKHYHAQNVPCPYRPVMMAYRTEFNVARAKATTVGHLASRVEDLDASEQAAFTLAYHHTDALPTAQDDLTPASVGTRSDKVLDHYETKYVWVTRPHMVSKQVAVQKVTDWIAMGPSYQFTHSHDDPTLRCENQYLRTSLFGGPPVGMPGSAMGLNRPGAGGGPGVGMGPGGSVLYTHTRKPVLGPVTEKVTSTVWATRSVTAMEPKTVTSTYSALVSTVPGQDISTSVTPWSGTGETRRVGNGSTQEATRTETVPGAQWTQDLITAAGLDVQPQRAQASSYSSDMGTGTGRLTISGSLLHKKLGTHEALASKPRLAPVGSPGAPPKSEEKPKNLIGGVTAQSLHGKSDWTGQSPDRKNGAPTLNPSNGRSRETEVGKNGEQGPGASKSPEQNDAPGKNGLVGKILDSVPGKNK